MVRPYEFPRRFSSCPRKIFIYPSTLAHLQLNPHGVIERGDIPDGLRRSEPDTLSRVFQYNPLGTINLDEISYDLTDLRSTLFGLSPNFNPSREHLSPLLFFDLIETIRM